MKKKNGQVNLKFGQVDVMITCPNGQVGKKVNVEPCVFIQLKKTNSSQSYLMQIVKKIFDWKTYIFTAIAVISFSNFMAVLFGQTIPGIFQAFLCFFLILVEQF